MSKRLTLTLRETDISVNDIRFVAAGNGYIRESVTTHKTINKSNKGIRLRHISVYLLSVIVSQ